MSYLEDLVPLEVETMEGHYLWLAHNGISACFSIFFKTTNPRMALPIVSWVFPHQSSIKICTTGYSDGGTFTVVVLSSK